MFNKNSERTCKIEIEYSKDDNENMDGYKMIKKYQKVEGKEKIVFQICNEEFVFEKKKPIDVLSSIKNLNIKDLNYLKEKYKKEDEFKHHVFEKIYILEQLSNNNILKYDVYWCCEWSIE